MSEQIIGVVKRGKEIHQDIPLQSQQLAKYLEFLKLKASERPSLVPCGGCIGSKTDARPSLIRAVNSFCEKQRADFYLKNILLAREIIEQRGERVRPFTEQTKTITWNFFNEADKQWEAKQIEINFTKLCIKFRSTREQMDLHNYVLRDSKKRDRNRRVLALQSIQNLQYPQTLRLSNFKEDFDEFQRNLIALTDEALRDNITRMTLTDPPSLRKTNSGVRLSKRPANQSSAGKEFLKKTSSINIVIPSEENVLGKEIPAKRSPTEDARPPQDSRFKQNIQKPLNTQQTKRAQLMQLLNNSSGMEVYRHNALFNAPKNRLRKLYEYSDDLSYLTFQWLSDNFMTSSSFRRWKKSLKQARTLSFNRESKKKVFFQLHQYKETREQISYVFTREKIQASEDILYFIDLPADQLKYQSGKGFVEYTVWKIVRNGEKVIISCEAVINHGQKKKGLTSIKLTDEFLGNFDYICSNLNMTLGQDTEILINSVAFEQEYLSQIDSFNDGRDDIDDFYSIEQNIQRQSVPNGRERSFSFKKEDTSKKIEFHNEDFPSIPLIKSLKSVKVRHLNEPLPKLSPIYKYPSKKGQHPYFEDEFSFSPQGQMVSINEEKLKAQSSVLKDIVKSIGKNLFSGKSILNMSLPVTVFSVQSNLSLLCKSYAYAPNLLQKAASQKDPISRLKYVAAFLASVTIAYLQMDKPFNPILGETFQAVFDGCPVYGQQVCHHPPISSTFMVGRGYRLYGSFQAKVNIGINTATGSNEGILNICFDNKNLSKQIVKVKYPPGEVTGLTFGVRKVAATQKGYILDVENRLFIQMNFNKFKGVTQYCKLSDGMQGRIVKLSPNTDLSKLEKIQKKHAIQQYGMISGRWTHEIFYDDELIFNSWDHMPYQYVPYPNPLPSNAYFREDLAFRIKNDYATAQTEKERLQQVQRNDRKLREKYTGKKH